MATKLVYRLVLKLGRKSYSLAVIVVIKCLFASAHVRTILQPGNPTNHLSAESAYQDSMS